MNYQKHYNLLIEKSKTQVLPEETYTEKHHILPKCLNGSDDKSNFAILTAKQHYIAHKLLVKIYQKKCRVPGTDKTPYYKMLRALTSMMWRWGNPKENMRAPNYNAKMYESWKKDLVEYNRICNKNWLSSLSEEELKEYRKKISDGVKGYIKEHGSTWNGKHHSEKSKKLMSEIREEKHLGFGKDNSMYNHHWFKNPNDKTQFKPFKEGEKIPEGWIPGKWQIDSEEGNKNIVFARKQKTGKVIRITNGKITKEIGINDPIPDGFKRGVFISEESCKSSSSKRKQINKQKFEKRKELYYPILKEQKDFLELHSWKEFVEKFDYRYSKQNFIQMCRKYLV